MDALDWITLAVFFAAGWYFGSRATAAFYRAITREMLRDLGVTEKDLRGLQDRLKQQLEIDDEDQEVKPVANIVIEKHNDTLYAFRKDNNQFIGQGTTPEALIKRIGEKARNCRFVVEAADGAELIGSNTNWEYKTDTHKLTKKDLE